MDIIYRDSNDAIAGIADFAKIDATTEEDIAKQIAEDDAEAAVEAALYASLRDKVVVNLHKPDKTNQQHMQNLTKSF